ncbi:putative holin-like toxin [Lachnospiraceae bacterium 54-53]
MDTYQVLTLLFLGGSFLVALPACLYNRNNKPKNNAYPVGKQDRRLSLRAK